MVAEELGKLLYLYTPGSVLLDKLPLHFAQASFLYTQPLKGEFYLKPTDTYGLNCITEHMLACKENPLFVPVTFWCSDPADYETLMIDDTFMGAALATGFTQLTFTPRSHQESKLLGVGPRTELDDAA